MNFAVLNLGCKVNRVESDEVISRLALAGVETTTQQADLIVINTCTVTGEAEKKTRKTVRAALRANEYAKVIVTGCACALDKAFYEGLDTRVSVVGKLQLLDHITSFVPKSASTPLRVGAHFRTRVGVKIQDGCNHRCTYCIIHVARGRSVSRGVDEVVAECVSLAQQGVREIILTGIDLGSYRIQSKKDQSIIKISDLITILLNATKDIHEQDKPPLRFRISSLEPKDIHDELIDLIARSQGRICRHLHLPLQAGSSKVLHEMRRPYDAPYYLSLVKRLRKRIPSLSLSTDIMVGFPGESDQDFEESLRMARACRFSKIHVFPFSPRAGTPAALRTDQIDPSLRQLRAAAMRALGNELRANDFARRHLTREWALVERTGQAMTESGFEVPAPNGASAGELILISL